MATTPSSVHTSTEQPSAAAAMPTARGAGEERESHVKNRMQPVLFEGRDRRRRGLPLTVHLREHVVLFPREVGVRRHLQLHVQVAHVFAHLRLDALACGRDSGENKAA